MKLIARRRVIQFEMSPSLTAAFKERRVYFVNRGQGSRFKKSQVVYGGSTATIEPYVRFSAGSNIWTMGAFSYSRSELPTGTVVGRYCSLGPYIKVLGRDHPIERLSTSPFTYNPRPFDEALEDLGAVNFRAIKRPRSEPMPVLGNDVWIGEGVTLARGIKIGDGAVVAARALVTRDIPPYEIWGGIPAKPIKARFDAQDVKRLQGLAWWRYAFPHFKGIDWRLPIGRCIEALEKALHAPDVLPFEPEPIHLLPFVRQHESPAGREET